MIYSSSACVQDQVDTQVTNLGASYGPKSLHIGIECDRGGAGRVISELMAHLPDAGFGFQALVGNPPSIRSSREEVISFAPAQAPLLRRLQGARAAIRVALQTFQPDVVASHFAMYSAPGLDLLSGQPTVSHFHGPWSQESAQEGEGRAAVAAKVYLEKMVYRRAHRVIVLSNAFAENVVACFGVDPARVRVVPGCVDVERFALTTPRAEAKATLALPPDRPILVTVRRLVNRMGLSALVDAMRHVVAEVPEVLLCVAGQGPLRRSLEEQVTNLGLEKNVQFLGFVPENLLPQLFYAADLNVVPTIALEGFGLVAAEALATGTPSMVTRIGGLPEVVGGLSEDLIFPGTTSAELAEGLIAALTGNIRLPTREQCREHVRNNFSSRLMAVRTAEVYRELI